MKLGLDLDVADEPQWYIPAGIDLPDLKRSLTVIEQFENTPLDLDGKRAAQLLHKKRKTRRRQRRTREAKDDDEDDDDADEGRKHKVARKARERENYTSAQFIEDSDEEYERDIEDFFAREAALRERTALAAIDSLSHIGTMRATGTKKRRRRQPSLGTTTTTAGGSKGRVAKRSRRTALSSSGMHDVDSEEQDEGGDHGGFNAGALRPSPAAASNDDGDSDEDEDDDDGGDDGSGKGDIDHDSDRSSRSFLAHRDVAAVKHRHSDPPPPLVASQSHRPKARPRYRGVPVTSQAPDSAIPNANDTSSPRTGTDDNDVGQAQQQQGHDRLPSRATTPVLPPSLGYEGDFGRQATIASTSSSNGDGPSKGRTRLIISDEEE